jgi:hypothetical protein
VTLPGNISRQAKVRLHFGFVKFSEARRPNALHESVVAHTFLSQRFVFDNKLIITAFASNNKLIITAFCVE